MKSWVEKNQGLAFIVLFAVSSLVLIILYSQPLSEPWSSALLTGYTGVSRSLLNGLGIEALGSGQALQGNGFGFTVARGCDAVIPMILLLCSILFYRSTWKEKFVGITVGILLLGLLNIIRISSLFIVAKYQPDWFDFWHTDLWQVLFIAAAALIWLRWLKWKA